MTDTARTGPDRTAIGVVGEAGTGIGGPGPGIGEAGPGIGEPGPGELPEHLAAVAAAPSVQRWMHRSGDDVAGARLADLEMLQRFCASLGTDPDELIAQCLRSTKSGDTAISAAGRRKTDQAISAFVAAEGASGRDAIVLGNKLRGFLIHNGIFMQGSAAID
jgi:hypothetical protein